MTEAQFKRMKLSDVMSYRAALILEVILQKKQAGFRYPMRMTAFFAGSKGANLLTRVCMEYIRGIGGHAERINTTGMPRKTASGKLIWTRGQGMTGSADIHAVINGRMYAIEIKYGRDRQSDAQKAYQKRIEAAGGKYIIVRKLDDLIEKL